MATIDWFISQDEMKMKDETSLYKFIEDKCDKFCDKCNVEWQCPIDTERQSCKFCDKCEWHLCILIDGASHCRPKTRKDGKTGFWIKTNK